MGTTTRGRGPRPFDALALGVVVALAALLGCRARPTNIPPVDVLDATWHNRVAADPYPDPDAAVSDGLAAVFGAGKAPPAAPGRPQEVLVLSGGGKYGAYTAGVLCAWTETGTRPQFDVCTGISSGALTASMAFLGTAYDERLAREYTTLSQKDVYRFQPLRGIFLKRGLATNAPVAEVIARCMDEGAFRDLCAAHCAGRRLFIGTVNITTQRAVIWDVGAIATSGRPDAHDLVKKILLAACTIPAFILPVEFDVVLNGKHYREKHVDAGNVLQAFVRTPNGLPPGSNLYIINAGKYYRDPFTEEPGFLSAFGATVSNSLYALFREDAVKLYALCAVSGAKFHMVAVPGSVNVRSASLSFTSEELRLLFFAGKQQAASGVPWRITPPASQPGETLMPRSGFEFVAEPAPQ